MGRRRNLRSPTCLSRFRPFSLWSRDGKAPAFWTVRWLLVWIVTMTMRRRMFQMVVGSSQDFRLGSMMAMMIHVYSGEAFRFLIRFLIRFLMISRCGNMCRKFSSNSVDAIVQTLGLSLEWSLVRRSDQGLEIRTSRRPIVRQNCCLRPKWRRLGALVPWCLLGAFLQLSRICNRILQKTMDMICETWWSYFRYIQLWALGSPLPKVLHLEPKHLGIAFVSDPQVGLNKRGKLRWNVMEPRCRALYNAIGKSTAVSTVSKWTPWLPLRGGAEFSQIFSACGPLQWWSSEPLISINDI